MLKNKKLIIKFLSTVFLAMPFIVSAELTFPAQTGLPVSSDLSDIIINIMNWLLAIVGVIGIIGFVISGIMYFLAAGDSGKMGDAKNAMMYSIIGVVVALMGYVIIQAATVMLSGGTDF